MFNWFDKLLVKIAKKILNKYAPTGEFIAYINAQEEKVLKDLGGYGQPVNETGVKSFNILEWAADNWQDLAKTGVAAVSTYASYQDQKKKNEMQKAAYEDYMRQVEAAGQEARAAIDINYTPMVISGVPTTKADVTDFTAVQNVAKGGLMSLPNKQRKRYARGPEEFEVMEMDEEIFSPGDFKMETGVDVLGEQVFYDTGRGDRANAAQIWSQMQNPDKAIFDFDFEIFFMHGGWRDMIKSEVEVGGDTKMASYDYNDAMGESRQAYDDGIKNGTIPATMEFDEYLELMQGSKQAPSAEGIMQAARGGRIGYREGIGPNQGSPTIMAEAFTDSEVEDAYGTSVEHGPLLIEIKQIAEQSARPESFPATDSDFAALEMLSKKHNVDLQVVIQMAKGTHFVAPQQSKGEMYAQYMAKGGRPGYAYGTNKEGIMNLGGLEKDYRTTGGFVPIGAYEKKDDVPARLSKNEFVMTADAVRAAGGGSINKGAQLMYDTMKHLEAQPTAKRMTA